MPDFENRQSSSTHVHNLLAAPREEFRLAMEQSAETLRRALATQKEVFSALKIELPAYLQAEQAESNRLMPITADFVSKAYERALELFDDLETKLSQNDEAGLPLPRWPVERPRLPQTTDMMNEATWYLNDAMKAVIAAMDKKIAQKPETVEADADSG